jgi:hypothetical protein
MLALAERVPVARTAEPGPPRRDSCRALPSLPPRPSENQRSVASRAISARAAVKW